MSRSSPPFLLQALCLALAWIGCAGAQDTRATAGEWQIKCAFIYNFTKFVEWPAESLADPTAPIVIGVLGERARVDELQALVKDRKVNAHPLVVRSVRTADEARATQVLFVSAEEEQRFALIRAAIADSPVLTVGESPYFSVSTGAIGFVQDGDQLRFEINVDVADRARLRISAQLQKLATAVHHLR